MIVSRLIALDMSTVTVTDPAALKAVMKIGRLLATLLLEPPMVQLYDTSFVSWERRTLNGNCLSYWDSIIINLIFISDSVITMGTALVLSHLKNRDFTRHKTRDKAMTEEKNSHRIRYPRPCC